MTELSATSAEPGYINRLALKHLPFSHVVPANAFFDGSHIKQRRLLLQHLLRATRRPVQLQAGAGMGKTTLLSQLQKNASSDLRFCSFPHTEDQLAANRELLAKLGTDSSADSEEELRHYLQKLRKLSITPVLLVDDVESLSDLSRQRLSHCLGWLDEDGQPLWQAVVCSKAEVDIGDVDFQVLDMPPLEQAEVAPYLTQRLTAAGYQGELPFSEKTIRRFFRVSLGNPAKLNQLAHQYLLEPVKQRQWTFKLPNSLQHIGRWAAASAAALLIFLVLIYQQQINEWVSSQSMQQEEVLSLPEAFEPDEIATVVAPEPETVSARDELRRELAELLAEIPPPAATVTPELDLAEIPPESAPLQPEPEPPAEPVTPVPNVTVVEPRAASNNGAEVEPKPPVDKSYGKEWILQQTAEYYTFQLMGSWETQEVDEFIEKNALSGDYARFSSLRDGKPWHVIVYGVYPSKKAALKASNQWPAPMNTLPTWLRRFDSVQKQIKDKGVKP